MTRPPAALTAPPAPAGVDVVLAVEDGQLRRVAEAQNEAYGRDVTTEHDVDRLRGTVERGGLVGPALDPSTGRTPAGGAEERAYRSVGYRPVTGMLHVSR